ncbi:hypothetical protein HDZ31DRAFT_59769 [Schizophyllum fasciatum]
MPRALEQGMKTLSLQESPNTSASEDGSEKRVRRRARPQYHKRLHPSHADIPFVPEAHDTATHRYWHFGWPVSDTHVNNIIETYDPEYLDDDHAETVKYARFSRLIKSLSQCKTVRLVLVEPDNAETATWQSPLAEDGEKGVTFCMVVSDCGKHFFTKRPTKEQMAILVSVFGFQPRWMMDAREKSEWRSYGHTK